MKQAIKKLLLNPVKISMHFYTASLILWIIRILGAFKSQHDGPQWLNFASVLITLQWICLLIAMPLLIVGQKRWSVKSALALVASLLLITVMLTSAYRTLFTWSGMIILLCMLLLHWVPRLWGYFASSYREISQRDSL